MLKMPFKQMRLALLAGLGVVFLAPSFAMAGYVKEVRDWFTYCTDGLFCTFETSIEGGEIYRFGFMREPLANAPVQVFIVGSQTADASIRIVIDGDAGEAFEFEQGAMDDNLALRFDLGEQQAELLEAMMGGSSISVIAKDGTKRFAADASLSGITGSALYVDDIQQKIGNRDALKAKGEGVASDAIITVVELTQTADLPAAVANFWRDHTDACAEGYEGREDLVKELGGLKIDLEEGAEMYLLPCGLPGAYNYPQTALIHDTQGSKVRQLAFPVMSRSGPTTELTPFNINWDARKRSLSSFYKGRGLGDCGTRAVWKIDGGFYANFILVRQEQKDDCDGNYENWPVVWPIQ